MKLRKYLLENKKPYYPKISLGTTKIEPQVEILTTETTDDKIGSDKDYVNVVKKIKKENVTPDNIAEIMLSQIPGISSVTALAIMEKYHTLSELLEALQENQECLKDLCYQTGKGQTRKINKTCIENIQKYLLKK